MSEGLNAYTHPLTHICSIAVPLYGLVLVSSHTVVLMVWLMHSCCGCLTRYPMLLSDLERRSEGMDGNDAVKQAGALVREIALTINEEKRKQEEVRALYHKFDGWNGPPLTVYSSMLFHEVRITDTQ